MDSITQEVDELLEADEEPSAPEPQHRPSPSVRARPVLGIGAQSGRSLGEDELEAALAGRPLDPGAPPAGHAHGHQDRSPRARSAAERGDVAPLPRFATDDSQPGFRPAAPLPAFGDPNDDLLQSLAGPAKSSAAPARGVVHAPPHAPPRSTPPPKPIATPAPPRPPSAAPAPPRAVGTLPPQGMTAPPASVRPLAPLAPMAPVAPMAPPLGLVGNRDDATLITRARAPQRKVSVYAVGALAVVVLGLGAAGVIFATGALGSGPATEPATSASPPAEATAPSAAAEEPKPATPEPPAAAAEPPAKSAASGSLLERASSGDEAALTKLEQRPSGQRSAEEALAIAAGRSALRLRAARELRQKLAKDATLATDPEIVKALREHAVDIETQREALAAMAELPDSRGADLLYEVWTRTPRRTPATELAEALLRSRDVRPKASKQVALAIELRDVEACESVQTLLARAIEEADRRALPPMVRFLSKRGCGPNKAADCFPCLGKRETVRDAIKAARERKEPKL